jgi:hypothetical protein
VWVCVYRLFGKYNRDVSVVDHGAAGWWVIFRAIDAGVSVVDHEAGNGG